ncbi:MAG: alternative ribosome rescue aminoacyl-tRNA hydrolase ArfB [Acidobacteriota bacterium]
MAPDPIPITDELAIPRREIRFVASRSSGPGGQHVNKVSSRATLLFDVVASPTLSATQKRRVQHRLATRVTRAGILRVTSQVHRSQAANRRTAVDRFAALLAAALATRRRRVPTRVPAAHRRHRVAAKRRRGEVKQRRRSIGDDE